MELEFFTCNDLSVVEALFEKAAQKDQVGISVLADPDQVYTVGLVLDEKEIYQIPVGGICCRSRIKTVQHVLKF